MIQIKCATEHTVSLTEMVPFQGDLKKRSNSDLAELGATLKTDGLITPFVLWSNDDKLMILDGHGRRESLIKLALDDISILEQQFPYIKIDAESEDEARQALLQINSQYGKINKQGLIHFVSLIPNYKAPVVTKYSKPAKIKQQIQSDKVVVRLMVPKASVEQLTALLKQVDGVEVY